MIVNSNSLLTQNRQIEASGGALRSEISPGQRGDTPVGREVIPALTSSFGFTAPLRSTVSQPASEFGVEERSLRVRLSRLALHETQLRQKLSEFEDTSVSRSNSLSGADATIGQKDPGLESSAPGENVTYSQNLLDQILLEKQILQRRLDALAKNTLDSEQIAPPDNKDSSIIVENLQGREARQESVTQDDGDTEASPQQKEAASLLSLDSLESAAYDRVNAEQLLSSSNALLSSRQNLIDQYYRDGNLDLLLESLEKQDKYMEAVMSALSPSRVSSEGQIIGELINTRV